MHGHCSMCGKLKTTYGIQVKRDTAMNLLRGENPEGTLHRKSRSIIRRVYAYQVSNSVWHVDVNEKIKLYSFSKHACIDGFFRKIIWLSQFQGVIRTQSLLEVLFQKLQHR